MPEPKMRALLGPTKAGEDCEEMPVLPVEDVEGGEMISPPTCPYCHCHLNVVDAHGLGCPHSLRRVNGAVVDDAAERSAKEKRFGVAFYAGMLVFVAALLVAVADQIARAW